MLFRSRDEVEKRILIKLIELTKAYINEEQYDKALNTLEEFFSKVKDKYNKEKCYSFNNSLEYILYSTLNPLEKDQCIYIEIPISEAYNLWGNILVKQNKLEEALKKYELALKYNPLGVDILFNKADVYRRENKLNKFLDVTKEVYKYIYDSKSLSRYYINLGYYYSNKGRNDVAYILYFTSTQFEENNDIYMELGRLAKVLKRQDNFMVSYEEAENALNKIEVKIGLDDSVFGILVALEEDDNLFKQMPDLYRYIRKLLYELTKDDKYM